MPQRFDVIFWDFDGTLAHSRHLWTNSICDALKQADPETNIGFDQLRPLTRTCYPWDQPEENYHRLQGAEWWSYMEKQFARAYEQAGVKREIARNAAARVRGEILRPEKYHLFEDTFWALEYCRREGCRNVLLSNNYPELEKITTVLGLTPLLDGMVVSGQVGWDKPRPISKGPETAAFLRLWYTRKPIAMPIITVIPCGDWWSRFLPRPGFLAHFDKISRGILWKMADIPGVPFLLYCFQRGNNQKGGSRL